MHGKLKHEGNIEADTWQKMMKNVVKERAKQTKDVNYTEWFIKNVDLVYTLWYEESFDEAFKLLEEMKHSAQNDDKCFVKELKCQFEVDLKIQAGEIDGDYEEVLASCEHCKGNKKSGNLDGNDGFIEEGNSLVNNIDLNIFPNPVNSISMIRVDIPQENVNTEINILSVQGQSVFTKELQLGENFIEINNKDYIPGIYFVVIKSNENIIARDKIIIMD